MSAKNCFVVSVVTTGFMHEFSTNTTNATIASMYAEVENMDTKDKSAIRTKARKFVITTAPILIMTGFDLFLCFDIVYDLVMFSITAEYKTQTIENKIILMQAYKIEKVIEIEPPTGIQSEFSVF